MASKIVKSETQIVGEAIKKFHTDLLYNYLVCQKCEIVPKTGEIYICAQGEHATCAACFILTKVCGICKTAITTPSKVLEQLRRSLPISCMNRQNGCSAVLTMDSFVYHELDCEWRPIFCPVLFCKAKTVIFNKLCQHLTEQHSENPNVDKKLLVFEQKLVIIEEYFSKSLLIWYPIPFSHKNNLFFLDMALISGRLYLWVYYNGSPEEAKNYKCKIKVFGDCDTEFVYNDTVRSLDESMDSVLKDERALVISATQAKRLVSNEGLKCSVKVSCPKEEAIEAVKIENVESDLSD
jgi:hypothetical protein